MEFVETKLAVCAYYGKLRFATNYLAISNFPLLNGEEEKIVLWSRLDLHNIQVVLDL